MFDEELFIIAVSLLSWKHLFCYIGKQGILAPIFSSVMRAIRLWCINRLFANVTCPFVQNERPKTEFVVYSAIWPRNSP